MDIVKEVQQAAQQGVDHAMQVIQDAFNECLEHQKEDLRERFSRPHKTRRRK